MRLQITIESGDPDDVLRMKDLLRQGPYAAFIMHVLVKASEHTTIVVRESVQRPKADVGPVISKPEGATDLTAGFWDCSHCFHTNPVDTIHCFMCGKPKES